MVHAAASNTNSRLSNYMMNGRWLFPRAVSTDITRMLQALPNFNPTVEDHVEIGMDC